MKKKKQFVEMEEQKQSVSVDINSVKIEAETVNYEEATVDKDFYIKNDFEEKPEDFIPSEDAVIKKEENIYVDDFNGQELDLIADQNNQTSNEDKRGRRSLSSLPHRKGKGNDGEPTRKRRKQKTWNIESISTALDQHQSGSVDENLQDSDEDSMSENLYLDALEHESRSNMCVVNAWTLYRASKEDDLDSSRDSLLKFKMELASALIKTEPQKNIPVHPHGRAFLALSDDIRYDSGEPTRKRRKQKTWNIEPISTVLDQHQSGSVDENLQDSDKDSMPENLYLDAREHESRSNDEADIIENDAEMYLHEDRTGETESLDEETDQPSTSAIKLPPSNISSKKPRRDSTPWRVISAEHSERAMPGWRGQLPTVTFVRGPIDYFREFFDSEILDHIVEESNLFAIQKDPTKPLKLDRCELEQFVGTLFLMSMMKISNTRLYWSSEFNLQDISNVFSRNRWEFIKTNLHCNNNDNMVTRDNPNYDPLFNVRPLLTHLQRKFKNIPMHQMMCVGEQIVPFKGVSQLKQYIPSKSHKWGYKIFALCDTAGILYDFEVYTGKIKPVHGEPDLGASSNIVLQLAKSIPEAMNHLLYFDNWFTSIPLVSHLAAKKIYCLATVRMNRVPGISSTIISDKELLKKGRGSYHEVSSSVDEVQLRVVKWADNRCVNLISSFSSACPMETCMRYDKKRKEIVEIPCPSIVKTYNSFMGGVDLMDALIALYRIGVRSKKYYHKLIFHFLDVSVVNSWLLYRRDCDNLNVANKERLDLQHFKLSVAKSLILEGKPNQGTTKVGRPSRSIEQLHSLKKKQGNRTKSIPEPNIRKDGVHHWPNILNYQNRCKMPGCGKKTFILCTKCETSLCLTKDRNCYTKFHT